MVGVGAGEPTKALSVSSFRLVARSAARPPTSNRLGARIMSHTGASLSAGRNQPQRSRGGGGRANFGQLDKQARRTGGGGGGGFWLGRRRRLARATSRLANGAIRLCDSSADLARIGTQSMRVDGRRKISSGRGCGRPTPTCAKSIRKRPESSCVSGHLFARNSRPAGNCNCLAAQQRPAWSRKNPDVRRLRSQL